MSRFTIIIPTHDRRGVAVRNVGALTRQTHRDFEVVVVDDGSRDGTAAALRALAVPFPLTVIEQPNQGPSAARNAGAAVAQGDYLLFLDDDMEADPAMVAEHLRSHVGGANVVIGDLPLHPDSPRNALSEGVGLWASTRRARLLAAPEVPSDELITGQLSISRADYERMRGFDAGFTRGGLAPGADLDFGERARALGLRIEFNAAAVSHQVYDVDPAAYLRRAHDQGWSSYELMLRHPDQPDRFGPPPGFVRLRDRILFGPLVRAPSWLSRPVRSLAASLVRRGGSGARVTSFFFTVRTMERLRGFREAQRTGAQAVVLSYHAIADHRGDQLLRRYSVPPARFAAQLDALHSAGWTFVDADTLLAALAGRRCLPARALLLTFDDGYADFATVALPELAPRGIPAVVFVVTNMVGRTNEWDSRIGATPVALMDAQALRAVAAAGVEIGSHGLVHEPMTPLDADTVEAHARESAEALEGLGLPRPRLFAYPYGQLPEAAAGASEALRRAGYSAAFTVEPGVAFAAQDVFALPRLMVLRGFRPPILRLRIATLRWRRGRLVERAFEFVGMRG